jgi:phospholipid/cholesterol/gamma-HCH transport system substrate-binding protein
MLRLQIARYGRFLVAIIVLIVVAAVTGAYVLIQQRLRTPFDDVYSLKAEFSTSSGLTPGLGLPATVAGVKVGTISGASVRNGRSVVEVAIERGKLPHVYADARATLVPNTPLKDMQVDIYPGRPPAQRISPGGTIPVAQTNVPIDWDELISVLDQDTRTWLDSLVADSDIGTRGRGHDIRALFRALGPTSRQLRQIGDGLAARRVKVSRLVHNVQLLTKATAEKDRELATVVAAGDATVSALASQDAALREAIARLPGTLSTARSTLGHTTTFANALGPALNALMPSARRLPGTLRDARTLFGSVALVPLRELRGLIREAQPVARDIVPATRDISEQTPDLTDSFKVLTYVGNELAYNPPGSDEGMLFWLAWFSHNANSVFSTEDAHGAVTHGLALTSCSSFASGVAAPLIQLLIPLPPGTC